MTCFAYDDLESWCGPYSEETFENQLNRLCTTWKKGLVLLEGPIEGYGELEIMAYAAGCVFSSCLNQVRFYRARKEKDINAMRCAAEAELNCAKIMLELMNHNAAIGFEAANHYYYSRGCLLEKIVNCHYVIEKLT